jgi:glycerophosphoryl diester phosphodiesterase
MRKSNRGPVAPIAAASGVCIALALGGCATPLDLQGHRGARGLAPENTLPAFARALEVGVTTLELDTGITRDGVVVVAHDSVLNPDIARGPDGAWLAKKGPAIRDETYESLERYDVGRLRPGSAYAKRYPMQVPVDGTRIPRLADVFALAAKAGNREVRFNIETKLTPAAPEETVAPEPFARAVIDEIRKANMASRATIQSFDWRTLQVLQREAREIPAVYLTAQQRFLDNVCAGAAAGNPAAAPAECEPSPWTAGFQLREHGSVPKLVKAAGGRIWSPYFGDLDAQKLKEAHDLGLRVIVWTVNEPSQIATMLDLGVDGLISDRPDLVREEMKKRDMRLPPSTPVRLSP